MNGFHKNYKVIQLFVAKENIIFHAFFREYKSHNRNFRKTLDSLKDKIIKEYSKNLFNDLHFIINWRNKSVHPGKEIFAFTITYEVLLRAQLVYALFMRRSFIGQ